MEAQTLPKPQLRTTSGAFPSTPSPEDTAPPTVISSQLSLSEAIHERRAEFTRSRKLRVKVGTWNVASLGGTEKDIGGWFVDGKGVSESLFGTPDEKIEIPHSANSVEIESVGSQENRRTKKNSTLPQNDPGSVPGGDEIGIYALGLQEIVDISSATEALRPFGDPQPARKWKLEIEQALPQGYHQIAEQQLIGLFLVIYASSSIMPTISSVSTTSVGTGLMGYMGNKGAVTARILLGETTRLVFINCHLTAGVEKGSLERRNWDASQILSRTKFDPVYIGGGVMEEFGEGIDEADFAFWFGDLNYRLDSMPGEDVRRLLMLHTTNQYQPSRPSTQKIEDELAKSRSQKANCDSTDRTSEYSQFSDRSTVEKSPTHSSTSSLALQDLSQEIANLDPSSDPASLQSTLSSLLTHDQLHSQMQARNAFSNGWREGPIDFLPTYKYDVGSVAMFDSSEKRRGPSWCDRILYRTQKDKREFEQRLREEEEAKIKDNEMKLRGVVEAAADEAVLFDYDPETDGADKETDVPNADPEIVITKAGFEDRLQLDYYTSHQRVLSSDHKPLDAVFTLTYDGIDPELKAKVQQEVARELDKAENEGRPIVTIVVDHHRAHRGSHDGVSSPNSDGVNFGDVKYDHLKTRHVTIANTGRVPATIGFADRSMDAGHLGGVAPKWLSIHFDRPCDSHSSNAGAWDEYTLDPGDAVNVELVLHITDLDFVRGLNDGLENIEDVLVLRIHNGRDYFLPLRGNWLQSAFGRSIEKLVRIPEGGIRRLQHQQPDGSSHREEGVQWSAPRELFRLTEAIEELVERAIAEWEMRGEEDRAPWETAPGWPFNARIGEIKGRWGLRERVREGLDCDIPFAELWPPETGCLQRLEALAGTLIQFLKSLKGGIITEALWSELEIGVADREKAGKVLSDEEERIWILDTLSSAPARSVSFTFVTFMLSRVTNETAPLRSAAVSSPSRVFQQAFHDQLLNQDPAGARRQQVDSEFAAIFADAMIRLPQESKDKARKASEARRKRVVEVFLGSKLGEGSLRE